MHLAAAIRLAGRAAAAVDGTNVTIQRDAAQTECLPATRGSSRFETVDAHGVTVTIRSQDFCLDREDYDFGDGPVEPARGDLVLVEDPLTGDMLTHELLHLSDMPSWRWADPWHERLRLHTKQIF